MKRLRASVAFCIVALAMAIGYSAKADTLNKLTHVTFNQAVELPGNVILQPGTYAFTVLNYPGGNRHIVQVFNQEKDHLYATILAIPNYRGKVTDKTVITFSETAAGAPNAIKEWFYPGHAYGEEFVYPKNRAVELAKISNEPVPAMAVEAQPTVKELEAVPLKAEEPSGKEVEVAEVFDVTPPTTAQLTQPLLPKTASTLPLIGLAGLLLLSTGTVLWAFSKRVS
jgi:hypothetical protein